MGVYYYHFDGLGSVTALSDQTGHVAETYQYSAFGITCIVDMEGRELVASKLGNPYNFTARRLDSETGLYYYRARMYSPSLGRFLQTDPVGYYDSMCLYQYCGNNPIVFTDPTGQWFGIDDLVASAIGAVGGLVSQGISDLIAGELSGWESYAGSAIGGVAAAETMLYTGNPMLAGAAGGAVNSASSQLLQVASGKKELSDFNFVEVAARAGIGALAGSIPGAGKGIPLKGINAGRNSFKAITKSTATKWSNNTITNVSAKTVAKSAAYIGWEAVSDPGIIAYGCMEGMLRRYENNNTHSYAEGLK